MADQVSTPEAVAGPAAAAHVEASRPVPPPETKSGGEGGGDSGSTGTGAAAGATPLRSKPSGKGRGRPPSLLLDLRTELPAPWRWGLATLGLVGVMALWLWASSRPTEAVVVPTPAATWDALYLLWDEGKLWADLTASGGRILYGYSISMAIGIVLGVLMGSVMSVQATFEAPIAFMRYVPASALVPLMMLWLGIDEMPKVTLIVLGTVFFNVLMVADVARNVPRELIEASYTLGARRSTVLQRVVFRHSLPGIVDVARINLAAAWLMLVVAELLAANEGLAYRIVKAQRVHGFDRMFAILLVFGVIGIVTDLALRWLRDRVVPVGQGMTATMTATKLDVREVVKTFPARRDTSAVQALAGVSLQIAAGELVSLVGTSGCGKSTLLRIVAGLERADTGEALVDGEPIIGPGPDRGMIFQSYSLFPWLTVAGNIAFGLQLAGVSKKQRAARISELLGVMGLQEHAGRLPHELSGGMRQRVAIARALAPEPDLLLLDEPFGALDAQTRLAMQEFLRAVWHRTGATILLVTHDVDEAVYLSRRIYIMRSDPGRIVDEVISPFEPGLGPSVKRSSQFLDLRDEIHTSLAE